MADVMTLAEVEKRARERLARTRDDIAYSLARIAEGNPLAAERTSRRVERIQAKANLSREEAVLISAAVDMTAARDDAAPSVLAGADADLGPGGKMAGPEAIRGKTLDFVGVAFLERGRRAANAVGRVAFLNGGPQGTGFMVAPGLFLTNHHVIPSAAAAGRFQVQFDYEYDLFDQERAHTAFFFDPEACFVTDGIDGLDFTLIGVGARRAGERALDEFGYLPISDATDKHMLGEIANVVQHPDGRYKEIVLRENHLVARDETESVLHYVADTEQGSSGSPVFNNEWEPIALHHWGGPWREVMGTNGQPLSHEINEGIRISAIVKHVADARPRLVGRTAAAVRDAVDLWDAVGRRPAGEGRGAVPASEAPRTGPAGERGGVDGSGRINADGSVTWTFPIEISVRAPLMSPAAPVVAPQPDPGPVDAVATGMAEAAAWTKEDFSDRGGYEPGFIPGFVVPLPDHSGMKWRAAKNQDAKPGEDPHELRYHHFSIVMNAERRLAAFTAVNIDGSRLKAVNRKDKKVTPDPTVDDLDVARRDFDGAESSGGFMPDRRVLPDERMDTAFYDGQKVPGFPVDGNERRARMFQKGHIILRGDPVWGTDTEAVAAERDTFFYTNIAPQVGFFNQGSPLDRPGSKGKLRWRAVETYVLRNALTMRQRISVFAGPVFDDDSDPPYRSGSRVPMQFWKIAVWSDGGAMKSIAVKADQRPVLFVMPEGIGAEAFGDSEELAQVSEFLSTVEEVEGLTGLDFGDAVRAGDIRSGMEKAKPALSLKPEDLVAGPKGAKTRGAKSSAKAAKPRASAKASKPRAPAKTARAKPVQPKPRGRGKG